MKSTLDLGGGAAGHASRVVSERDERATEARERASSEDRDEELWGLAVAQLLVQRLPPLPRGGEAEPAVPTRNGAAAPAAGSGELAPPESAQGRASAAGPGTGTRAPETRATGVDVPSELSAEVSDERFGRLQLHVARGGAGLDIVINVADSRVKALIEAEHAVLIKTLKDAGLRVASVQIGSSSQPGTGLALDRAGAERPRAGAALPKPNARRRVYPTSREEEEPQSSEGVDFTA
jgi:hypothetical protein